MPSTSRPSPRSTRRWCWRSPAASTVHRRENVIALGLGLAACQNGVSVGFTTAAALVHELMEACDDKPPLRCQKGLPATSS